MTGKIIIAPAFAVLIACGGAIGDGQDGGDAGDGASFDEGTLDDAGFTACTTPEGYRICGANTPCPSSKNDPFCDQCAVGPYGVGVCGATLETIGIGSCSEWCPDNELCSSYAIGPDDQKDGNCIPFSLGVLFEKYSADPSIVHYSDVSSWTGQTVPDPSSCPTITGLQTCGGGCGGCPPGDICSGRSSLHPVGVCVPGQPPEQQRYDADGGAYCTADGGDNLFIFDVDPPSQNLANQLGRCMPTADCQTLAAQLPGGGTCVAP